MARKAKYMVGSLDRRLGARCCSKVHPHTHNRNHTALRSLQPTVTALTELERLELTNNDISDLPPAMGRMPRLKSIALEGNPLRALRGGVLNRGTQGILKFLR